MVDGQLIIQFSAFPGWIVGVSYVPAEGFYCWVITPELAVLNDGECYCTSSSSDGGGSIY